MMIPFHHLTGQSIGWRELGSSLPCSACLGLLAWVAPGDCWKEYENLGYENPSMSTRTPSTLTLVGEHLEDDDSPFKVAFLKVLRGEPLGNLGLSPRCFQPCAQLTRQGCCLSSSWAASPPVPWGTACADLPPSQCYQTQWCTGAVGQGPLGKSKQSSSHSDFF